MLGRRADVRFELEPELLAVGLESMTASGQPDPVDLQPVAEPGLADVAADLEIVDERVEFLVEIGVELADEPRHDAAQQHTAEARRRVDRKHHLAERHPAGRGDRAGVIRLEDRQRHVGRLLRPALRSQGPCRCGGRHARRDRQ